MQFKTHTLLAILLATSAAAQQVNSQQFAGDFSTNTLVKRSDALDLLSMVQELNQLMIQKREISEDHEDFHELSTRANNAIYDFISALTRSGLLGDVFRIITTDAALQAEVTSITRNAIQGLIVQGPALLAATWNSGLLQDVFTTFLNDADLRNSFIAVIRQVISTMITKIKRILSNKISGVVDALTPEAAAAAAAAPPAKRELTPLDIENLHKSFDVEFSSEGEFLDKRDTMSTVLSIVQAIYNSGLVQSMISSALEDPIATITFLTEALKNGIILISDLIRWAKEAGLTDGMMQLIATSESEYLNEFIAFVAPLIEEQSNVEQSDIQESDIQESGESKSTEFNADLIDALSPLLGKEQLTTFITSAIDIQTVDVVNVDDDVVFAAATVSHSIPSAANGTEIVEPTAVNGTFRRFNY